VDLFPKSEGVTQAFSWDLPFEDNSFDGVLFSHVVEHIPVLPDNLLVKKTFREFHRVLKDGGELVVITPHISTMKQKFWDDPTHIRPYTMQSIRSLGDKTKFRVRVQVTSLRYLRGLPFLFYKLNQLGLWYTLSKHLSKILPFGYKENIFILDKI